MQYDNSLGIWGNLSRLFTERNHQKNEIENNKQDADATKTKVEENQIETDEMMLDHEERIILLEVGE